MNESSRRLPEELLELRSAQRWHDQKIQMVPMPDVLDNPTHITRGLFKAYRTKSEVVEPDTEPRQQTLLDLIALRPDQQTYVEPITESDKVTLNDTLGMTEMLIGLPNASWPSRESAVWARRVAYQMEAVPFECAHDINGQFNYATRLAGNTVALATHWLETIAATDPEKHAKIQEYSQFIAVRDTDRPYIEGIMAVSFAQIEYSKRLAEVRAEGDNEVSYDDINDESLPAAPVEPRMVPPRGLEAAGYTEADLIPWELEASELLSDPQKRFNPADPDENEILKQSDAKCVEPGLNYRGDIHRVAIDAFVDSRSARLDDALSEIDAMALAFLIDSNMLSDRIEDLQWIRRFIFDRAGMLLDDSREAARTHAEDVRITDEQKQEWIRDIEAKFDDEIAINSVFDEAMETIYPDLAGNLRRHYKLAAAITLDQIRHLQELRTMMSDIDDENSEQALAQLADDTYPATEYEPAMTGPEYERLVQEKARLARIPTDWPVEQLLRDPSRPYDPETNSIIEPAADELIDRGLNSEQMAVFRSLLLAEPIRKLREKADQDIQTMEGLRSWFSKDMARKLLGAEPTKEQAALAHRARAVVFDLEGISHDAGMVGHIHNVEDDYAQDDTYAAKWRELAITARQTLPEDKTNAKKLYILEEKLALLADTAEDLEAVREYAYLTLSQINKYRQIKANATANN